MQEGRILVVDDERWIRVNLKRLLESEGYSVSLAEGGEQALRLMDLQPFDLIITDHRMPRMSGLELLEQVKEKHPDMLRVILTGFADLQLALDAINKVEVHRLLLKPYSRNQILETVQELLELKAAGEKIAPVDLNKARIRKSALDELQKDHPGIAEVKRDRMGRIIIDTDDVEGLPDEWMDIKDLVKQADENPED